MNMKLHPEERQALKDEAFVRAEREWLEWQEWFEEIERKPAKIVVIDKDKILQEDDRIEADSFPF